VSALKGDRIGEDKTMPLRRWRLSRRGFLIGMAVSGTALALGIPIGLPVARRKVAGLFAADGISPASELNPLLWLEILPDNRLRVFVPKAELGQGTHTGLAQLAADELEVPWDRVEVLHASTAQGEDKYRGTYGSQSIMGLYEPFRRAAATMREMLKSEAAVRLKQPPDALLARDGAFEVAGDPKTRIAYGELVSTKANWRVPTKSATLKAAATFKLIGQSVPRIDLPSKVTGQTVYGYDFRLENMLYGAIVRPPTLGARMISVQSGRALRMPGVVKVIVEEGFAGVVAKSRSQAAAARDSLDVQWDRGHLWQQAELERIITAGGPGSITVQSEGDAAGVLAGSPSFTAEYRVGFGAHATLEPQVAVADITAKGGKVWTSTQWESAVAAQVATALGVKEKYVEVIPTYVGGGFGRKADTTTVAHVAVEAARLSKAVGAPVHVGWDRREDLGHEFYRPMAHYRLSAALDEGKRVKAIAVEQATGDVLLGILPGFVGRAIGIDMGAMAGAYVLYDIPHIEFTQWNRKLPIPTGPWRGVGLFPGVFAMESFIDELAHAAGADPLKFRLDHLRRTGIGERLRAVLVKSAEVARWGTPLPVGRARGIACCAYAGTTVAEVGEISLNRDTGKIRLHAVVAAIDCGRPVNPDAVIAQVEGCVIMGTSAALIEEIIVKDGRVVAENFDQYPLLTMDEAPEVRTVLVGRGDGRPGGVGEPPVGPVGAVIGNAFFALTGVRLRHLPMTPERVKRALGPFTKD
jgi:isoquinoline 1-oxidoreductase beta subunit